MPPEYLREGKISHKTDIYSLGVIMCEIITGEKVPIGWSSYSPKSTEFTESKSLTNQKPLHTTIPAVIYYYRLYLTYANVQELAEDG